MMPVFYDFPIENCNIIQPAESNEFEHDYELVKKASDVAYVQMPYGYVTNGIMPYTFWRNPDVLDWNRWNPYVWNPKWRNPDRWNPCVSIGIFSGTGSGKNTFLEETLFPDMIRDGGKALLFYNRTALGRQIKRRIAKLLHLEEVVDHCTAQELDDWWEFGPIMIVSYQQLENRLQYRQYDFLENVLVKSGPNYVICDEAHYFLSDAAFNGVTEESLDYIMRNFPGAQHIYMTATPDEIFPILKNKQEEMDERCHEILLKAEIAKMPYELYKKLSPIKSWRIFEMEQNYDYLQVYGFTNRADLVDIIKESDQKWIIFVESKELGREMLKELEGAAQMITAESKEEGKKGYQIYQRIVETETFESQVLITTAVLENGVNIRGNNITKIVLFTNDKTKFFQMLGRVRRSTEQKIDLYIPDVTAQAVRKHCNELSRNIAAHPLLFYSPVKFGNKYLTGEPYGNGILARASLNLEKKLELNYLAREKEKYFDLPQWEKWDAQYEAGEKYPVLKEKFRWLQKEFHEEDLIIESHKKKAQDDFLKFLESVLDKPLDSNEQKEFRKLFTEKHVLAYGRREENKKKGSRVYGVTIIRRELKELQLPYSLYVKGDTGDGTWCLRRNDTCAG